MCESDAYVGNDVSPGYNSANDCHQSGLTGNSQDSATTEYDRLMVTLQDPEVAHAVADFIAHFE